MAAACQIPSSNTEIPRNVNRTLLSAHEKFLNFNANNSHGDTSKNENTKVMSTRNISLEINITNGPSRKTSEVMKRALAGVGTPMKESF